MEILIATTSATSTIYALTDNALDLLNYLTALWVFFSILTVSLLVLIIAFLIFD